ncbi:MAG: PAS domain S-box protein [Promethearchaeota archaeon]
MEEEFTTLIKREDIPKDVKLILEKLRDSYINQKRETKRIKLQKTEDSLRDSEEKYRNLFHFSHDAIFIYDLQGNILDVNQKVLELIGYTKKEIIALDVADLHPPDMLEASEAAFEEIAKKGFVTFEIDFRKKSGKRISTEVFSRLIEIKGRKVIQGIVRDVSEQKKAHESEDKYRTILESIEDGYYEVDLAGNFSFFNKKLCKILRYPENEILGMNYKQYCSESTAEQVFKAFNRVYRTERPVKGLEFEYIRKDGTLGYAEVSVSLITDSKGIKYGFRGIIRDISDRKVAEIALQEAKEKYQMLIERMEEGVVLEDANGFFTFVNPQTVKLLGYTEEEILNKHWSNFVAPECLQMVNDESSKRPEGISSKYEAIALGKTGQRIQMIVTATPLQSKEGEFEGVLSVFTDITRLKRVEQQLYESERRVQQIKLEEERYHAMLSHFLNNDLQKILFNLDLLNKYSFGRELDQEIITRLMSIIQHSSRNIDLVKKIFVVLQSELPFKTEKRRVIDLIHNTLRKITPLPQLKNVEVNESSFSNIKLEVDNYFYDMLYELLFFILSSNNLESKKPNVSITIEALLGPLNLCISIRDNYSQTIPQSISTQLTSPITENWETRGHYLPIALASVIMKRYDGTLKINPLSPNGNEFQLLFPLKIVQNTHASLSSF